MPPKSAKTGENVEQSFATLAQAGLLRYDALEGFDISDIPIDGDAMLESQPKSSCGFCGFIYFTHGHGLTNGT